MSMIENADDIAQREPYTVYPPDIVIRESDVDRLELVMRDMCEWLQEIAVQLARIAEK